jgi:SAM-dependent methyltransferase
MGAIEERYTNGSYLASNPRWDREDAPWKAERVYGLLSSFQIAPTSVCEVGCGAGDVLVHLRRCLPQADCYGYDISPQAAAFWEDHKGLAAGIHFQLGDFHMLNQRHYDVLLMLDVFEHVRDPFTFLERTRPFASYFVFHIPLDLSASAILRGGLMAVRSTAGHIHHYTKDTALATLQDCGYHIMAWRYTGASLNAPNRSLKTRLAAIPRRVLFGINKEFGVRAVGGETLLALARAAS